MLSRKCFGRYQKRVGPRIQKLGECRIQLIEIAWTDGVQQDVRLIGGDFCLTHAIRHAGFDESHRIAKREISGASV